MLFSTTRGFAIRETGSLESWPRSEVELRSYPGLKFTKKGASLIIIYR